MNLSPRVFPAVPKFPSVTRRIHRQPTKGESPVRVSSSSVLRLQKLVPATHIAHPTSTSHTALLICALGPSASFRFQTWSRPASPQRLTVEEEGAIA